MNDPPLGMLHYHVATRGDPSGPDTLLTVPIPAAARQLKQALARKGVDADVWACDTLDPTCPLVERDPRS